MAKKKVVDYIREQLQNGYSISQIKNVMLKYGYTNNDIDEAVNDIYNPTIRHEIHLSKTTIIVVVFIALLAVGSFSFFYFGNGKTPSKLMDLKIRPVTTTVAPGDDIVFVKELSNLGSSIRFDVLVKQEVLDSSSKTLTFSTETMAIETFGSTPTEMNIPANAKEGDYTLRVIIEHEGKILAVATSPVKISGSSINKSEKQETCFDKIKNQNEEEIDCGGVCKPCEKKLDCNDNDQCTFDFIEEGKCINRPLATCCGNGICEQNEQQSCSKDCNQPDFSSNEELDKIGETAKTDPSKAMQECSKIEFSDTKDACIANIAEAQQSKEYCSSIISARIKNKCYHDIANLLNDNSICEQILDESYRDSCYANFFINYKDYSVCGKLINKALKQSCESLKQLSAVQQAQPTQTSG